MYYPRSLHTSVGLWTLFSLWEVLLHGCKLRIVVYKERRTHARDYKFSPAYACMYMQSYRCMSCYNRYPAADQ
ncbi:hypothetical protein J3F83DRAFT_757796 [Trichoderma novae-zelandiae]